MVKLITLPCITPGCTGHVVYNPSPLPALALSKNLVKKQKEIPSVKRVYLTCDNTTTGPHKNVYLIS